MPSSFRLGKIADIDLYAHVSWFILLVLLTWSLASGWFVRFFPGWSTTTYWIVAFISAMLLFACVLVHELAHALVARKSGLKVRNITLFVFGGVASIDEDMKRPGIEFWVALAGPLTSFLLSLVTFLLAFPLRGRNTPVEAVLNYLAVTNLFLGMFNLIPGFPLDGGRILRSIIWKITGSVKKSTRLASVVLRGRKKWCHSSCRTRHSPVPILILPDWTEQSAHLPPEETHPVRVMVPLDGSILAEAAIAPLFT